jgi:sodium transport system permease protein
VRWSIALTIFRKEILETLRDRRTLAMMLVLPLFLYPVLILIFGQVITHQITQLGEYQGRVMVLGELPAALSARLAEAGNVVWTPPRDAPPAPRALPLRPADFTSPPDRPVLPEAEVAAAYTDWARSVLDGDQADLVLVVPADFGERLAANTTAPLALFYDDTLQQSQALERRLVDVLLRWRQEVQQERLVAHPELPAGFALPLHLESVKTTTATKRGGFLAGRIIPIVLMVMVMLGAFYPAIDLTAGEKERGTMQTLLTAPAQATEIIGGKFLTVFVVAMISALVNLLSMTLAIAWLLRRTPNSADFVLHVNPGTVVLVLLQLVPVAIFFSALMLAIAVFAHSFKEAQNYLTPVYMLVIIPAGVAALPSVALNTSTAWVPGLNIMLLVRQLLVETPALELIAMVLVADVVFALLAIVVAVRVFRSEQVLLGGQFQVSDVLSLHGERWTRATPLLSLTAFSVNLLVLFYVGARLQEANLFWGLLATQWLLIFLPAIGTVRLLRLPLRETLSLLRPSPRALLAAALLGLTAWAVLGRASAVLQDWLLPVPVSFERQMKEALGLEGAPLATWQMVLAFCVTPALCEEFFFRGLLLGGFRDRLGKWAAILLTGLLFGLFHISIYRILPTALLGMLITWVVYETRSLWAGCLLHLLNNLAAVLIMKYGLLSGLAGQLQRPVDWLWFALAAAGFVAGLCLVPRTPPADVGQPARADVY